MPPAAFAPGGQGRKFFQMFLVLVAVYCSIGYALALAITRGRWSGFTEACIRDGKGSSTSEGEEEEEEEEESEFESSSSEEEEEED
jgi:hypothetical protein